MLTARILWMPKAGSPEEEWEDGAALDLANNSFALFDGTSTSARSYDWSELLSRTWFEHNLGPIDLAGVKAWVDHSCVQWAAVLSTTSRLDAGAIVPDWLRKATADMTTAQATILTVTLMGASGDVAPTTWLAGAIGDTCLFHIRGTSLVRSFPIEDAAGFSTLTAAVSSDMDENALMLERYWEEQSGVLLPGDILVGATDALAEWCLRENDPDIWYVLPRLDQASLRELVTHARHLPPDRRMRDDDVTLAVVAVDGVV